MLARPTTAVRVLLLLAAAGLPSLAATPTPATAQERAGAAVSTEGEKLYFDVCPDECPCLQAVLGFSTPGLTRYLTR